MAAQQCINFRLASHGDICRWLFQQGERTMELPVKGRVLVNDGLVMIEAALAGLGLTYTFEPHMARHLASGQLERCLEAFCPVWAGYHYYYPGRRQKLAALSRLIEHLRRRR